jgi:hypothetical protein
MPLETFAAHGACVEVRVPWLDPTVWLVPTDRDVAVLMHAGVSRGRIWTAHELRQLLALGTMTPPNAQTLAKTKLALDGSIEEVRPRADQPPEPPTALVSSPAVGPCMTPGPSLSLNRGRGPEHMTSPAVLLPALRADLVRLLAQALVADLRAHPNLAAIDTSAGPTVGTPRGHNRGPGQEAHHSVVPRAWPTEAAPKPGSAR